MKLRTMGALLATLLWIWGMSASIAEARGSRRGGGGFGGFRSAPRSGGGGGGLFGGFRSRPRPPADSGFGGFRSRPAPSDSGSGSGIGGFRRPAPSAAPIQAAPPGTPRLGTAPATTPAPAPSTRPPSNIATPLPSARPSAAAKTPESPQAPGGAPSSIATPLPSGGARAPGSSGLKFSTRNRPGGTTPVPARPGADYRRGWGGVYVPPGYGYWHMAPYHWLWWAGMPNPYPMGGPVHRASLGMALLGFFLFIVLAIAAVAAILFFVRRATAAPAPLEKPVTDPGPGPMGL